jgi:peptidoglycan/LPS O-acetylase OafA/YrhL
VTVGESRRVRPFQLLLSLDVLSVLVFVVIGRSAHTKGESVGGVVSTAWPFLVGMAAGWLATRSWRRPEALVPTGIVTWLACVAVGMVLRVVAGPGTAFAFVLVALGFLGLTMLGWRLAARAIAARRRKRAPA